MRVLSLIFLIVCSTCLQVSVNAADNNGLVTRIINGTAAKVGQLPYVVQINYGGVQICTGSIIHKNWILTAAHCLRPLAMDEAKIYVGAVKLDTGVSYGVKAMKAHPNFTVISEEDNNGVEYVINDIGLLNLNTSISFNSNVKAISLPKQPISYQSNNYAIIAGYGIVENSSDDPSNLQYALVRVLTEAQCKVDWPYADARHVCTSTAEKRSVCYGDSGGATVYGGVQIGIICTADTNCEFKKSNLHTNVAYYLDWIKRQLAESNDTL